MARFWLSFADDDGFRGAVIIDAKDFLTAIRATHVYGINPGGEVQGLELPEDVPVPKEYLERLLSKDEIEKLNEIMDALVP